MKHGILFFLNMGRITTGARIAIIPLIYLTFFQVRLFGIAFFTFLFLLIVSFFLGLIPAPSDRTAKRTLQRFYEEHSEEMLSRCGFANDQSVLLLHGYEQVGDMRMSRTLGREVVYPHPIAIGFVSHLGRGRLLIGKKTLLKRLPPEYIFWQDETLSEIELTITSEPETEDVAKLTLSHPSLSQPLTIFVKNDYRVRDFVEAMDLFAH